MFCGECLESWVEAALERSARVRCPAEGCRCLMYPDDVQRVATYALYEKMIEMRHAEHSISKAELLAMADDDPGLAEYLADQTQTCPQCSLVIEREDGCDEMVCHCGCGFCFRCGSEIDADMEADEC